MSKDKGSKPYGFDRVEGSLTIVRLKRKNKPAGDWRTWEVIKIHYSLIKCEWVYEENSYSDTTICPFGMTECMIKLLGDRKVLRVMPEHIREGLMLPEMFCKDEITMTINSEDMGFESFFVVFCKKCHSKNGCLSVFSAEHSAMLPNDPKLEDIWENWDRIVAADKSAMDVIDVCGYILPNQPAIRAGPNARRFLIHPTQHYSSKCHNVVAKVADQQAAGGSTSGDADPGK